MEQSLQKSRYYDSNTGRSIPPDHSSVITATPMGLTDKNLYDYCNNNPISHIDPEGEFPFHILIGAVVGGGFVFRVKPN